MAARFEDVLSLPPLRTDALAEALHVEARAPNDPEFNSLREGSGRDIRLFAIARELAVGIETLDELIAGVRRKNSQMAEPLPDPVAIQKALSAWKYKIDGKLMVSGSRTAVMDHATIDFLTGNSVAVHLLI